MHLYHLVDEDDKYTNKTLTLDPETGYYGRFHNVKNKLEDLHGDPYTYGAIGPRCDESIVVKVHVMLDGGDLHGQKRTFEYWKQVQEDEAKEKRKASLGGKMPATLTQHWGTPSTVVSEDTEDSKPAPKTETKEGK